MPLFFAAYHAIPISFVSLLIDLDCSGREVRCAGLIPELLGHLVLAVALLSEQNSVDRMQKCGLFMVTGHWGTAVLSLTHSQDTRSDILCIISQMK